MTQNKKPQDPIRIDPDDRALLKEIRTLVDRTKIQSELIDEILIKVEEYIEIQLAEKIAKITKNSN